MLMGTYSHALDEKGRVCVPARFREDLGTQLVITKNPDRCLGLYSREEWKRLTDKMDQLPKISSEPARRIRRFYFGNSQEMEPDRQGRILIPNALREYANLVKDVTLVGVDDHIEIWDSNNWDKFIEDNIDSLSDIAENLFNSGLDL